MGDRVGEEFWSEKFWEHKREKPLPEATDPRDRRLANYPNQRLDEFFRAHFSGTGLEGDSVHLLEVGCARSDKLPYFAREFGFRVAGLDYSEVGCEQARSILEREDVDGQVACADLFDPPERWRSEFDVAVSFGVVEHFDDTGRCLSAIGRLVRPGGLVITVIPNMKGLLGWLQRLVDPDLFRMHLPLDPAALGEAHDPSMYRVLVSRYFMFANFGALNAERWAGTWRYTLIARLRSWVSRIIWAVEKYAFRLPSNRWTSPYVVAVARRQ